MSTGATFPLGGSTASAYLRLREPSRRRHRVSCQRPGAELQQASGPMLDRRDLLIGLGGLYGATAGSMALATPVMPPDLAKCHRSDAPANRECCPPFTGSEKITDYDFPVTPLRVRRPAHEVVHDEDYIRKYTLAVQRMKALPDNDPWNFFQQANVHCQYCNATYDQTDAEVPVQIHHSWLFLPWHRYYLHFYERILGKLIGDDTFTIPFWNFDHPKGMTFPRLFDAPSSSLYDPKRDPDHVREGVLLDYRYAYSNPSGSGNDAKQLVLDNLDYLRKTFQQSLAVPELFMGDPLRAGEAIAKTSSGQLEVIHNAVHMWVGLPQSDECPPDVLNTKCHINMGDLSTAARDSVFFSIHNNVDRLWDIYRNLRGNRLEFDDRDWLDSTFLFTDENRRLVRVQVGDCLDTHKLCYTFAQVYLPWLGKLSKPTKVEDTNKALFMRRVDRLGTQPQKLDAQTPLRVLVARPKTSRKKAEKEDAEEVLQIEGIEASFVDTARFDVYVAAPYGSNLADPDFGEFVGSFLRLAHAVKGGDMPVKKTKLKLGLNVLLEEIEAEGAEKLVVTLVLRTGDVSVGGIAIRLVETDNSAIV